MADRFRHPIIAMLNYSYSISRFLYSLMMCAIYVKVLATVDTKQKAILIRCACMALISCVDVPMSICLLYILK